MKKSWVHWYEFKQMMQSLYSLTQNNKVLFNYMCNMKSDLITCAKIMIQKTNIIMHLGLKVVYYRSNDKT